MSNITKEQNYFLEKREDSIITSVNCIEIPVSDMQRAVDFYVNRLGLFMDTKKNPLPIHPDNTEVFIYPAAGPEIMLVKTEGNERMLFTHKGKPNHMLILEVNADAEEYQYKLTKEGITTTPIKDSGGCGKSLDVFDPDGNLIKLWFGFPRRKDEMNG